MVRSRSRPNRVLRTAVDVSLIMVCEEEELSPVQKAEHRKALQAYREFSKQIDEYKANNAIIEYLKTPLTPAEIKALESKPVVTVEEHVTGTVIPVSVPVPTAPGQVTGNRQGPNQQNAAPKKAPVLPKPAHTPPSSKAATVVSPGNQPSSGGKKKGQQLALATGKQATSAKQPTSSRPQRRAARAAIGLINETMDVSDAPDEDDDVIIVNESMARNLPAEVSGKNRHKVKAIKSQLPTSPTLQPQTGPPSHVMSPQIPITVAQLSQVSPIARQTGELFDVAPVGAKRMLIAQDPSQQPKRKQKKVEEEQGSWVPLDEYYYGKKEGDPAYREEKGEYRFKCWYCHKMLYNNLRIMMHMQGHIDSEKQQNLDLADLTQCKHCYKQFDTPFEMQNHVEKVHQAKWNVLVCRICEKDHDNQGNLRQHMKQCHNACEMPYICQLCNFRSSVYTDVVDHFKKRHDSSQCVLCFYCLKIFKVTFSKASGWGLTQNYYQHLQKHQSKINNKKCPCCKLTFINKLDVKIHRQRDHLPNFRGAISGSGSRGDTDPDVELVMIKLPTDNKTPKVKSLNAPVTSKVQEVRALRYLGVEMRHMCRECGQIMLGQDHYKRYVECSLCRYATLCNNAYSAHMMSFHSGKSATRRRSVPEEQLLVKQWYCLCGYQSRRGNGVANHLVICSKRTAYLTPPEQKFFEYDDEQEEFNPFEPYEDEPCPSGDTPPEKEIPSLFGALGLVRKPDNPALSKKDLTADQGQATPVAKSTEHARPKSSKKILKGPRQAEHASRTKSPVAASSPDDIPPELTGAQKWSTVHIKDGKAPTKASVFLGSQDDDKDSQKKEKVNDLVKKGIQYVDSKGAAEVSPTEVKEPEPDKGDDIREIEKIDTKGSMPEEKMEKGSMKDDQVTDVKESESDEGIEEVEQKVEESEPGTEEKVDERSSDVPLAVEELVEDEKVKGDAETMDIDHTTGHSPSEHVDDVSSDKLLEQEEVCGESPVKNVERMDDSSGNVSQNTEDVGEGRGSLSEAGGTVENVDNVSSDKLLEQEEVCGESPVENVERMDDSSGNVSHDTEDVGEGRGSLSEAGGTVENVDDVSSDKLLEQEEVCGESPAENVERMDDSNVSEAGVTVEGEKQEICKTEELPEMLEAGGLTGDDNNTTVSSNDDLKRGTPVEEDEVMLVDEGDVVESEAKSTGEADEGNVGEDNSKDMDITEQSIEKREEDIEKNGTGVQDTGATDAVADDGHVAEKAEEREEVAEGICDDAEPEEKEGEGHGDGQVDGDIKETTEAIQDEAEQREATEEKEGENSMEVEGKHVEDSVEKDDTTEQEQKDENEDTRDTEETDQTEQKRDDKEVENEQKETDDDKGNEEKVAEQAASGSSTQTPAGEGVKPKTNEAEGTSDKGNKSGTGVEESSTPTSGDRGSDRSKERSERSQERSSSTSFRSPDRSQGHRQGLSTESSRSHDRDRPYHQRRDDYRRQDQRQGNYRHDDRDRSHDRYHDNRYRQDGYRDNRHDYHDNRQGGYNQNRDRYGGGGGYNQRGNQRGGYYGNDGYRGRGRGGGYQGNRGGYHGYY